MKRAHPLPVHNAPPVDGFSRWGPSLLPPFLTCTKPARLAPHLPHPKIQLLPVRTTSAPPVLVVLPFRTDTGLTGLGEASDAFGFANATAANVDTMRARLQTFFDLVRGGSPLDIERYRQRGMPLVKGPRVRDRFFSDRAGDVGSGRPGTRCADVHLVRRRGSRLAAGLRRHQPRDESANCRWIRGGRTRAVGDGFRAIKAAPFDGFPPPTSPARDIEATTDAGIAAVVAM